MTFNVILTITNDISKNVPSSGTKCLPVFLQYHVHSPPCYTRKIGFIFFIKNNMFEYEINFPYKQEDGKILLSMEECVLIVG